MPNQLGQGFALTVISPIIAGHTSGTVHATEMRAAFNAVGVAAESPLARIDTLHFARFTVLDDLRPQGMPFDDDHLASKYLVFVADFDGDLPSFLEALRTRAGEFTNAVWSNCLAWPGTSNADAFRQYFEKCQLTSTFPFGAYAQTPLRRVLRALDSQRRLIAFLRTAQGLPPAEQLAAFQSFTRELAAAPLPQPGTV